MIKISGELKTVINSNHQTFLLISTNREKSFLSIKNQVEDYTKNISKNNNSSVNFFNFFLNLKVLEIDKVREITKISAIKFQETRFIILSFYSATLEAQNALLKFTEEPATNLKIIFIVSGSTYLLPTLESRLYQISEINSDLNSTSKININLFDFSKSSDSVNVKKNIVEANNLANLAWKFLKTKKLERMKLVEMKEILEKEDVYAKEFENKERKDREVAENFLLELEKEIYLYLLALINKNIQKNMQSAEKLETKKAVQKNLESEKLEKVKMSEKDEEVVNDLQKEQKKELLKNLNDISDFKKYIKLNSSSPKTIFEYLALSVREF